MLLQPINIIKNNYEHSFYKKNVLHDYIRNML